MARIQKTRRRYGSSSPVRPDLGATRQWPVRSPARRVVLLALAALSAGIGALAVPTSGVAAPVLPDGRGYEMVTPLDKNGIEVGPGIGSTNGNAVNWEAIGGCCGSTSAASTLFQSSRTSTGWKTVAKTPTPSHPLVGLFEEQQPLWWSGDLSKTVYTTPASYAAGDNRPQGPGATFYLDLYEQDSTGAMSWLTQGPFAGAGTNPDSATFASATPDGNSVVFDTPEQLTPDATGLADLNTPAQFLYVRNISAGTTSLVDVATATLSSAVTSGATTIPVTTSSGFAAGQNITIGTGSDQETDTVADVPDGTDIDLNNPLVNGHASGEGVEALISPDGAIAGNGNQLGQGFLPADGDGTTTNSISSDGSKVFFESPPSFPGGGGSAEGVGPPHLFMRDFATNTTTQLDTNPTASDQATYEGASQDGSLVFFTSDEGLGGDTNTDNELYEFNTTAATIGPAPAMSAIPLSGDTANDGDVVGVTAISNDGSHVWFVAHGVLAGNTGAQGETATAGAMNFYVVNTATGNTTFIAQLGSGIASDNRDKTALAGEPDIDRAAIPTPTGNAMAFESSANLTNQNPSGPTTTLTDDTSSETEDTPVSIPVASTAGFIVGRTVEIETSTYIPESATITAIPDSTHLLVTDGGIGLFFPHFSGDQVIQRPPFEVYRYNTADNSIVCISCAPAGVTPTGSAGLGAAGGGSYEPPGNGVPMTSDGSKIFFDSPDPLVPGVISSPPIPIGLFGGLTFVQNVYEWNNGTVSLISDGQSTTGSSLGSTTPTGNDVFITTEDQLTKSDTDGYDDIYDARVGGGFPAPPTPTPPCASAESCRTSVAPTVFFPTPGSSTLIEPNTSTASFSVNNISAKQRKHFAKTGKLTITVHVSQAGKVSADGSALIGGERVQFSNADHSFFATKGGKAKLTLKLNKRARRALGKKHKLVVDISVSYSESSEVDVATLTLTDHKSKSKKATILRPVRRRGAGQ